MLRAWLGALFSAALVAACSGGPETPRSIATSSSGDEQGGAGANTGSQAGAGTKGDTGVDPASITGAFLTGDFDDSTSDTADVAVVRITIRQHDAVLPLSGVTATCEIVGATGAQLASCSFTGATASTTVSVKRADLATAKGHTVLTDTASGKSADLGLPLLPLSGTALQAFNDVHIWPFGQEPVARTLAATSYCDSTGTPFPSVMTKVGDVSTPIAEWSPDKSIGLPTDGCFLPLAAYVGTQGATIFAPADVRSPREAGGPAAAPRGGCSLAVLGKDGKAGASDRLVVFANQSDEDERNVRATIFKFRCR